MGDVPTYLETQVGKLRIAYFRKPQRLCIFSSMARGPKLEKVDLVTPVKLTTRSETHMLLERKIEVNKLISAGSKT